MEINFVIVDQYVLPIVYVDDIRVPLVDLTYHWHTRTDQVDSEISMCVADAYIEEDHSVHRFTFDILNDIVTEEILEEN